MPVESNANMPQKKIEDYSPEEIEEMQKKSVETLKMFADLQKQQLTWKLDL